VSDGPATSNHAPPPVSADSGKRVENEPAAPIEWLAANMPGAVPTAIDRLAAVADPEAAGRVADYDEFETRFAEACGGETPGPEFLTPEQYKWVIATVVNGRQGFIDAVEGREATSG